MGPMWNKMSTLIPKDHWIHKALSKEQARLQKRRKMTGAVMTEAESAMPDPIDMSAKRAATGAAMTKEEMDY